MSVYHHAPARAYVLYSKYSVPDRLDPQFDCKCMTWLSHGLFPQYDDDCMNRSQTRVYRQHMTWLSPHSVVVAG